MTVGMDEAGRVHANEFLAGIAVHGTRRRIGLDHQAGLQINNDQPVTGGFKEVLLESFPFFSL